MRRFTTLTVLVCLAMLALPAYAQLPTGTITGQVRLAEDQTPLPGVTVTAESPAMQGVKTAITGETGEYLFRLLPPGEYELTFSLPGMQTVRTAVKVTAAQTREIDAELSTALTEEITVTGSMETISSGSTSATTYESDLMEKLPAGRDLNAAVLLTPGTAATGPRDGITIAGAQSNENLFLVNGVVVNENLRGQAFGLFIEDAIQETTTLTSGVSAEYGRFTGGVVNMITKQGGNEFSGSLRTNLANDSWNGKTPLTSDQEDKINEVYEGTFGGYLMKDHLWFFLAGRDRDLTGSGQLVNPAGTPFTQTDSESRYEVKLTGSPHVSHRVVGSYISIDRTETNDEFYPALEVSALDPERSLPQELMTVNYTGVLNESFFVEGQYSERQFTFEDSGGTAAPGDRLNGTPMLFYPSYQLGGSMFFCGTCGDEERNNENLVLKGSWFATSERLGSHEVVLGYDTFTDIRKANNYQSPSNFVIWNYNDPTFGPDGTLYPMITGGEDIDFWPIMVASRGTDLITDSVFLNDTWRVNNNLTINMGVRYDKNDGKDAAGNVVADDDRISPRLGAAWDIQGNGEWTVNASYGRYVAALANSIADSAGGGNPSYFGHSYGGPPINAECDEDGNCTPTYEYTTPEALALMFQWFDSVGGVSNTDLWYASPSISGANLIVEGLSSPYTDEYMVGLTKRLGQRGMIRADYVHRDYGDFYATRTDLGTGTIDISVPLTDQVTIDQELDLSYIVNEDDLLERKYDGLHTQFSYRINDRVTVAGNWTWSHTRGNFEGENAGSGPITSGILNYPEYFQPLERYYPYGDLAIDQRHRARAWVVWDVLQSTRHNLSLSLMQNFATGTPYGAAGRVYLRPEAYGYDAYIENPGYMDPPVYTNSYYFTGSDAFRTDDITATDISFNYSFFVPVGGRDIELFIQPEVFNLFNEDGAIAVDTTVRVRALSFDPFTETPEFATPAAYANGEGNWTYGSNFGKPLTEDDYQAPRTFRVSLGVRF